MPRTQPARVSAGPARARDGAVRAHTPARDRSISSPPAAASRRCASVSAAARRARRRRGPGAPHRLRQHREPAPRARADAAAGDARAPGARRIHRCAGDGNDGGKRRADRSRCAAGALARRVGDRRFVGHVSILGLSRRSISRWTGASSRSPGDRRGDAPRVVARAGAAGGPNRRSSRSRTDTESAARPAIAAGTPCSWSRSRSRWRCSSPRAFSYRRLPGC